MTDRERLIELLITPIKLTNGIVTVHEIKVSLYEAGFIADHLLANGVIVQKQGERVSAPIKEKGYDSKTIPTCTNCGYQNFIKYTYCPECGAKLKEREQNDR